jgi:hypothetical protein
MISDVLFEARQEIERYQRDFGNYEGMEEELEVVKAIMANCQARLDVPDPVLEPILWKDVPGAERARDVLRGYEAVPGSGTDIVVRHGVAADLNKEDLKAG